MKQHNLQREVIVFSEGANYSVDPDFLGIIGTGRGIGEKAFTNKGYLDARNMRIANMNGNQYAHKKIQGEELIYPLINNACIDGDGTPLPNTYKGMLGVFVNDHALGNMV